MNEDLFEVSEDQWFAFAMAMGRIQCIQEQTAAILAILERIEENLPISDGMSDTYTSDYDI